MISLFAAEFSFILAWLSYSTSQLSYVLNPIFLIPLALIPLLRLKKNPFSFEFLAVLIAIYLPKIFPATPLYTSFINALNFAGFTNVAYYLTTLKPQPTPTLPLVITLFCFSQIVEGEKIQYAGVAFLVSILAYLLYPVLLINFKPEFIIAFVSVGILAVVYWFLSSS